MNKTMNNKMKKRLVVIAAIGLLLSGCVISIDGDNDNHGSWSKIEKQNRQYISELSPGSAITAVRSQMGTPDFDELIVKNENQYRILFYRTQRSQGDGVTTKDECTPIVFVNGELIGFGQTALESI